MSRATSPFVARVTNATGRNGYTAGLLGLAVLIAVAFTAVNPATYASILNVQSIAFSVPEIGLMALAISIAMTTAGIDLSIVAVANLSALTVAFVSLQGQEAGMSTPLVSVVAVAAALVVGLLCGAVNAVVISIVGVAPILATLATQMLLTGLAVALTRGEPIYGLTPELTALGTGTFARIPIIFWLFLLIVAVAWFIMSKTGYGMRATLVGANAVASDYSGLNRRSVIFRTYMLTGIISALAGLMMVMRTVSASAGYGSSYLLLAITIAVLGGVSPFGGRVAVWGAALAAVILQLISSGFNLLGISPYIYQMVQGLILAGVMVARVERVRVAAAISRWRTGRSTPVPSPLAEQPYEEGHHGESESDPQLSSSVR
jgi:simple sugar transport system permease protein